MDLALTLNKVRVVVVSEHTEALDWKQLGVLTGLLGLFQHAPWLALGTHSSSTCSSTVLH